MHQDLLVGERRWPRNAERAGLAGCYRLAPARRRSWPAGARVVLVKAPKALDALREIAEVVAAGAAPDVTVLVGGRVKHMTHAMNDVLRDSFAEVARHAGPAEVAGAGRPRAAAGAAVLPALPGARRPRAHRLRARRGVRRHAGRHRHPRAARPSWTAMAPEAGTALDLGCGTGVLAAALARARPGLAVLAADQSAAAVASAARDGGGERARRPGRGAPGRRRGDRARRAASTSSSATRRSTWAPRW